MEVVIDLFVTTERLNTYTEHPYLSSVKQDSAALERERRKRLRYGNSNRSMNGEVYKIPNTNVIVSCGCGTPTRTYRHVRFF